MPLRRTDQQTSGVARTKTHTAGNVTPTKPSAPVASNETPVAVTTTGAGHAPRLVDLVKALVGRDVGDDEAKRLLDGAPALRQVARLFTWVTSGDAPVQAMRHHVVNTDDAAQASGDAMAHVKAYAQAWGYADARVEGGHVKLVKADGGIVDAGALPSTKGGGSIAEQLRALGRIINAARVGAQTVVPPTVPLDAKTAEFSAANATLSSHLGMLAYQDEGTINAQLAHWGFDVATFSFIEDKRADTQGFVCNDAQGHTHVAFRGSESKHDAQVDADARLVKPSWAPPTTALAFLVHEGFDGALGAVWPQVKDAFQKARAAAPQGTAVCFSGHSLGAALTHMCGARLAVEGLIAKDVGLVVTQGEPRGGNDGYKALLEEMFPRTYRMVHGGTGFGFHDDPVTGVPPKIMGFRHAGNRARITKDGVEIIKANTPGARNALEARLMSMAPSNLHLGGVAQELRSAEDPADPELPPQTARLAARTGDRLAANGMAMESLAMPMMGVDLHFIAGYLEDMGKELLRNLG